MLAIDGAYFTASHFYFLLYYLDQKCYFFDLIIQVMPLENNMKNPQNFLGCFRVLNTAMVMIVCLFTLVGFFGFLKYGPEVQGSISLDLPEDEW
jgi:solute carrier family 36 (proton-coupled amino acid transporter)